MYVHNLIFMKFLYFIITIIPNLYKVYWINYLSAFKFVINELFIGNLPHHNINYFFFYSFLHYNKNNIYGLTHVINLKKLII